MASKDKLRGIGGWLAFYVVYSLLISVPILGFVLFAPHEGIATWSTVLDMSLDIVACLMLLCKYRYAVRITGISLVASFLIGAAWSIHDSLQALSIQEVTGFLLSIVQVVLWLGYFHKSRRVRNTYGSNLEWYG